MSYSESEISRLQLNIAKDTIKLDSLIDEKNKSLNKSNDFVQALKQAFESSSQLTKQFSNFHRLFKKDFTKILTGLGATNIEYSRGHFESSGFFTLQNGVWYFSLEDVRWNKESMLVRTAKDYKDYNGGANNSARLNSREEFISDMKAITSSRKDCLEALRERIFKK